MMQTISISKLLADSKPVKSPVQIQVENMVGQFMAARTSFHKLHLRTSPYFTAHKTLEKVYKAMEDNADTLTEQYQGSEDVLIDIPDTPIKQLNSIEDGKVYLRELKDSITALQKRLPQSEIVNILDESKSGINKFLFFLK